MSASTITTNSTMTGETTRVPRSRWQTMLFWGTALTLFLLATGMRLYNLGLLFDRDGYDEGVYWQSLRAMSAGHPLYQQIFYSQPPFFLLSAFPGFALLDGTLWSGRFGIALVSLLGMLGAFLLGKALAGRLGAIMALLLMAVDTLYLVESQKLMAEGPSVAFSMLAVGLAYLWWEHPEGRRGLCWAALTGVALALSILSKLLCVVTFAAAALLMLARLWQIWRKQPDANLASLRPILVGIAAFVVTMLLVLLPFLGSLHSLLQDVVSFHTQSASVFGRAENTKLVRQVLLSVLGLAALYGTLAALLWRDWRVIPLIAWLLGTAFWLWRLVPLFPHHLGALTPPLIALAVMGIRTTPMPKWDMLQSLAPTLQKLATPLALLLMLAASAFAVRQDISYYAADAARSTNGLVKQEARISSDLGQAITAEQWVVTDAQFIADMAGRNTPPELVDTSMVRIVSGDLTLQQLIDATSQPQVHAVLFFSGRFYLHNVRPFHEWVAAHFHLLHSYGQGVEMWVR
jgi:Dolichyl-phosphate-mannose-protein mannosyltransferase